MSTAQLKTMHLNETGPHNKLAQVLDSIKYIREQYECKVAERSIWESNGYNSIGLSSSSSQKKQNFPLVKATGD